MQKALITLTQVGLFGLLLLLNGPVAWAKSGDKIAQMDINISGTVVANGACTLVSNASQLIDFQDILFSLRDGTYSLLNNYRRPLDAAMTCSGDTEGNLQMKLASITGKGIAWQGEQLLPVTNDINSSISSSLGIRLLADNQPKDVDSWFSIDSQHPPKLEAELVLIANNPKDFNSGTTISSAATLTIAFN